jgi:hypothetical protein
MSARSYRPAITRQKLIGVVVIEIVLFLLANVTAKNSHHPGLISNVFWIAFLAGAALLIILALATLVRKLVPAR